MHTANDPWTMTVGEEEPSLVAARIKHRNRIEGTSQQEEFWEELLQGTGHILLEARAGTGKSTSCREGMWRLNESNKNLTIRYCCFNKKISEEFAVKAPPRVDVGTMHRFGLLALQSSFGCQIDKNKTYVVLDGLGGTDIKRYFRRAINALVSAAKNHGLRPDDPDLPLLLDGFIDHYNIEVYRQYGMVIDWAIKVLAKSAEMTSLVDFDDMLWFSVIHPVTFPNVDFLFIDEAQDLNPVQHQMAEKLAGSGRTIVVGDPFQSIYAFRGADSQSIPKLRDSLNATTLPLTVTFRCPRSHVELAQQLVPDFECAPDAPTGTLEHARIEAVDGALPGDLVLCRTNAPVIAACLRQIANLVPATVRGRAIGDTLLTVVRKVGDKSTVEDFISGLNRWRSGEINRLSAKDGTDDLIEQVSDKSMSLEAIASACSCPTEIPFAIQRLFSDEDSNNRITFSSVHRAKGSEAKRVLYIQVPYSEAKDRVKPPQQWERDQRRNLRYVALTRSLDSLTLLS
jgi:DNA helicase-2/ATP-dependent DNA helicase PcrA